MQTAVVNRASPASLNRTGLEQAVNVSVSPPENGSTVQAVIAGMLVMLAGTIPRNILFAANLRYVPSLPWAVPIVAVYLWIFWRYLSGDGPPPETRAWRRSSLRANPLSARAWTLALLAGGLGIVALVLGLWLANRMVVLPAQDASELAGIPPLTVWSLLLVAAPVAGIIEEAAFRGYMQRPLERLHGPAIAILVTGTMFAVAHLDFTPILWPYYVAVAAVYGMVSFLTDSIRPAIVLHTAGNLYSNTDLLLHGKAEWQAPAGSPALVWSTGVDTSFAITLAAFLLVSTAAWLAYRALAVATTAYVASGSPGPDETTAQKL